MKKILAVMAVFGLVAGGARGALILYTEEGSFLDALAPGFYTENFEAYSGGYLPSLDGEEGGFAYTVTAPNGLWRNTSSLAYTPWLGTNNHGTPITIAFTSGNVSAVGGYLFLTDFSEQAVEGSALFTIDGSGPLSVASAVSGSQPFIGVISSDGSPFSTLVFSTETDQHVTFNGFTVGMIPEPSTLVLFGCIGAMLWAVRRRLASLSS